MTDTPHPDRRDGILGWLAAHPKTTAALALVLLLILAATVFDGLAERRLQRRLDAIRASGAPLSIDDLNAAMCHIPDDENMAVQVLEHTQQTPAFTIPADKSKLLPIIGTAYPPASTGRRLPEDQLEAVRWYIDGISEHLAGIHEALQLDSGCIEVTWTSPALNSTSFALPGFSMSRQTARVLALEATLAAEDGDVERTGGILLEMMHFESVLDCQKTIIAILVQIAISALAQDRIEWTVNLCGLSEPRLRQLQAKLREREDLPDLKEAMRTERVLFIDTMECVRSGGGRGAGAGAGGFFPGSSYWGLVPALPELDESDGLDVLTAVVDAIDKPDAASINRAKAAEARGATLAWYCVLSRMSFGSFSKSVELWVRGVGSNRALQAALAAERYRLATGAWPDTLDDLVPQYLDTVPLDPFDGKPIRYARIDEGIRVWCIGEDLTDDGGNVKRLERSKDGTRQTDWGWVLLDPDLRGRPADDTEND